jgi:hypothetical protein
MKPLIVGAALLCVCLALGCARAARHRMADLREQARADSIIRVRDSIRETNAGRDWSGWIAKCARHDTDYTPKDRD